MSERSRRYGLLLLLLPRALRRKHGREMQELFAIRLTSVRERGGLALAAAWARGAADVVTEAVRLRWRGVQRRGRVRPCRERQGVMIGSDVRYALRSLMRQKLATGLVVGILALGGAYGVTSYLVTQRAREIGIRLALGARSADVASSVLKGSLRVAVAGVVLGTAGSVAAARLLSSLLFGVPPHEPLVLGGAIGLLLVATVLANSIPAWRASQVDPVATLRAE